MRRMCFSSTASFTAAGVLLIIGVQTVQRASRTADLPFAAIPLFFAFQQGLEGLLWLSLLDDAQPFKDLLTQAFSLFSQVVWPVHIPVAVLLLEGVPWRRKVLIVISFAGAAVSVFLLYYLVQRPVVSVIEGHHIRYIFPHFHTFAASGLYLMGACVAPLVSSHRVVRLFGLGVTISLGITYVFYDAWFISVWCFFAAALSVLVLLFFRRKRLLVSDLDNMAS